VYCLLSSFLLILYIELSRIYLYLVLHCDIATDICCYNQHTNLLPRQCGDSEVDPQTANGKDIVRAPGNLPSVSPHFSWGLRPRGLKRTIQYNTIKNRTVQ
jgi:hypothetical protein